MNREKIEVLRKEAYDAAYAEMKEKDLARYYSGLPPEMDDINLKFAELIVKECVDIAMDNDPTDTGTSADAILKHFGIEDTSNQ